MNYKMLSTNKILINVFSPEESEILGYYIGKFLYPGLTILLTGELGAGKTQITKGIGRSLNIPNIKSPSFIIVAEYESKIPLIHVDLFRLEKEIEVDFLDLESYIEQNCILVVEWAEKWNIELESDVLKITLEKQPQDSKMRSITIEAIGERVISLLTQLNLLLEEGEVGIL